MNTQSIALAWYDYGVTPIPCKPGTKIPSIAWGRWMDKRPSRDLVTRWFTGEHNLALMCGAPLLVLDFDILPEYLRWCNRYPDLAQSYTVRTGRPGGRHVYLRCEKPTSTMHLPGIDVQASRALVMAPPSVHPSGRQYTKVGGRNIAHISSVSEAVCWKNSVKEKRYIKATTHPTEFGVSHDLVGHIRATLPILTLLSHYTQPIPSSRDGRWHVMRCPHPGHIDRNPSFWCDAMRGICGCFKPSCKMTQPGQRPMDVFNLYGWLHGLSNGDAIRALAREVYGNEYSSSIS